MGTSWAPYLLALDPEPSDITVVITGILLVFVILLLLTFIIMVQGKIFDSLEAKKAAKKAQSAPALAPKPAAASVPAAVPAPSGAVPGEVVAAIAAAVACVDQAPCTIRSITPLAKAETPGRKAWGQAGVAANTAPF